MTRRTLFSLCALGLVLGAVAVSAARAEQYPAEFSPDGRVLTVQTARGLFFWDLQAKVLEGKAPSLRCRQMVYLQQDGWMLCVGDGLVVYDWKRQTTVASVPNPQRQLLRLLAYSQDTDRLVIQEGESKASVWQGGATLTRLKDVPFMKGSATAFVAASPDGKRLAVAQDHTIRLHDLMGTAVREIDVKEGQPRDLLFSPNGGVIAASIGNTILFIDVHGGSVYARAMLTPAEGARGNVVPRNFSPDGRRLVADNFNWSIPLFDAETGKLISLTAFTYADKDLGVRQNTHLYAMALSNDGNYLVGQPEHPYTLGVWDLRTGSQLSDLCGDDCRNMGPKVGLLRWSPDGTKIVAGMHGTMNPELDGISVWDVKTRTAEVVLDAGQAQVKVLASRPLPPGPTVSGKTAPSVPNAGPAYVHELAVRALAVSPSSNLLASSGDEGWLKVWDPAKGALLRQLKLAMPASALAFNANGRLLAAGTTQGEIRIWDTDTWHEYPPYPSRQGNINALQFLPGDQFLVIAGSQPKVVVLNVATQEVAKELLHTSYYEHCDVKHCERRRETRGDVVNSVAVLEGTSYVLTTSRTGRVVWDTTTWTEVDKPAGFPENWSDLGWKRPYLSTTTWSRTTGATTLAVWDIRKNGAVATFDSFMYPETETVENGHTLVLGAALAMDPQQKWVATRVGERVSVWDMQTQTKKKVFYAKLPMHLHWTSDGRYLVIGTRERKVLVLSSDTWEPVHYLRDPSVPR